MIVVVLITLALFIMTILQEIVEGMTQQLSFQILFVVIAVVVINNHSTFHNAHHATVQVLLVKCVNLIIHYQMTGQHARVKVFVQVSIHLNANGFYGQ